MKSNLSDLNAKFEFLTAKFIEEGLVKLDSKAADPERTSSLIKDFKSEMSRNSLKEERPAKRSSLFK